MIQKKQKLYKENIKTGEGLAINVSNDEIYDPKILLEILQM